MGVVKKIRGFLKRFLPMRVRRYIILPPEARRLREYYFGRQLRSMWPIMLETGETHNFTYDLTPLSLSQLSEMIAVATKRPAGEITDYINEAIEDRDLRAYFDARMEAYDEQKSPKNVRSPFGRRLGWYAFVRALKPQIVIETGVGRGHGSLLLCAALLRNEAEGFPGRYFGTDNYRKAGWLLSGKYAGVGQFLFGDSIESLKAFDKSVDLFINDSDHSADYEAEEYRTIASKLSEKAVILGDNSHVTDKLAVFSRETGRHFLMFHEQPANHWYPGGGIGISFPAR